MSILINRSTRLIVQGITGREGSFHAQQMIDYNTNVTAGVTPGKGGSVVSGVPVFDTVREAAEKTQANASILFVPARYTYDGIIEAYEAGIKLIITVAEHVPLHDMLMIHRLTQNTDIRIIGPNSFGIISPGEGKAGFMAHRIFSKGSIGIMSRSATNCYETAYMLTKKGIGQSTVIGIGGDMIPGSSFVDLLPLYEADPDTNAIVMIGEIGGFDEEQAAEYIKNNVKKPVTALIAGKNAPKGRSMGHAGAIVLQDGSGSARKKEEMLKEAGVHIAQSTEDIVDIISLFGGWK